MFEKETEEIQGACVLRRKFDDQVWEGERTRTKCMKDEIIKLSEGIKREETENLCKKREEQSIKAMEPDLEPEPGADPKRTSSATL